MNAQAEPRVGVLVLAAGHSRRAGCQNKLLAELAGVPLVKYVVDAALASTATPVVVVTGHEAAEVRAALAGSDVTFAHNSEHTSGLSASLRAGLDALPAGVDGTLVCLADMPLVQAHHLDALVAAFCETRGRQVCVPYHRGRRGNPVLWPARCFAAIRAISGDVGAKGLLADEAGQIQRVATHDDAVLTDIDTPEALARLRASR